MKKRKKKMELSDRKIEKLNSLYDERKKNQYLN
jgi:hypothetical protein